MKICCILFIILIFSTPLFASEFNVYSIYDKGDFENKTYYNEMFDGNTTSTTFKSIGENKDISILKNSRAELIECPKKINDRVVNDYISFREKDTRVIELQDLSVKECVKISYEGMNVYLLQFFMKISTINATIGTKIEDPVIWIGLEKNNELKQIFFKISDSRYLKGVNVQLAGIADINNDGNHDIVIGDTRYAGRSYITFSYSNGELIRAEFHGDSWD